MSHYQPGKVKMFSLLYTFHILRLAVYFLLFPGGWTGDGEPPPVSLQQEAQEGDGEDAEEGGQEGAVGGQLLALLVDFRQAQQDAGAGGARQDQDAVLSMSRKTSPQIAESLASV